MTKRFKEWAVPVILVTALLLTFQYFFALYKVHSYSMHPTLEQDSWVLCLKHPSHLLNNQIVIFEYKSHSENHSELKFIKRIAAQYSDCIVLKENDILLNKASISKNYALNYKLELFDSAGYDFFNAYNIVHAAKLNASGKHWQANLTLKQKRALKKQLKNIHPTAFITPKNKICLKKNEFYVLGDQLAQSSDSRKFGVIKKNQIISKALLSFKYTAPFSFQIKQL